MCICNTASVNVYCHVQFIHCKLGKSCERNTSLAVFASTEKVERFLNFYTRTTHRKSYRDKESALSAFTKLPCISDPCLKNKLWRICSIPKPTDCKWSKTKEGVFHSLVCNRFAFVYKRHSEVMTHTFENRNSYRKHTKRYIWRFVLALNPLSVLKFKRIDCILYINTPWNL